MNGDAAPADRPLVIFGGTFDPVHEAHLECARTVSGRLGDCPVHLLPNAVPPHREQPRVSAEHRRAMLELACGGDERLQVDERELRRSGPSWTLDTLREFRAEIGPQRPLVFLLGADSYARLDHWRDWEHYRPLCHLAVAPRPGAPEPPPRVKKAFAPTTDPAAVTREPAGRALLLDAPLMAVTATEVRAALEQGRAEPPVPAPVLDYIRRHGLYGPPEPGSD